MLFSDFDRIVIGSALIGVAVFVVTQAFVFRFVNESGVLNWLIRVCLVGLGAALLSSGAFIFFDRETYERLGLWGGILVVALAVFITGLASFFYVLGIFGPYESSVRLRVIREFYASYPHGLTLQDLLQRYNAKLILDRRIARLLASGEIVVKDGRYFRVRKKSVFMSIDLISRLLHKIISTRSK